MSTLGSFLNIFFVKLATLSLFLNLEGPGIDCDVTVWLLDRLVTESKYLSESFNLPSETKTLAFYSWGSDLIHVQSLWVISPTQSLQKYILIWSFYCQKVIRPGYIWNWDESKNTCLFDTDTAIHKQSHRQANYACADNISLRRKVSGHRNYLSQTAIDVIFSKHHWKKHKN